MRAVYQKGYEDGGAADRKRLGTLTKAICEELCECGSFNYPAEDEHDETCPYRKFMAALAAGEET